MNQLSSTIYKCRNSACESKGWPKELDVVTESDTGAQYLRYEDEIYCGDCGQPMEEE